METSKKSAARTYLTNLFKDDFTSRPPDPEPEPFPDRMALSSFLARASNPITSPGKNRERKKIRVNMQARKAIQKEERNLGKFCSIGVLIIMTIMIIVTIMKE